MNATLLFPGHGAGRKPEDALEVRIEDLREGLGKG
jgi:hypothetical protein